VEHEPKLARFAHGRQRTADLAIVRDRTYRT
jgi:hypothetical protein